MISDYQHRSYKLAEPEPERKSNNAVVSLKSKLDDQANEPFRLAILKLDFAGSNIVERQLSKCPFCPFVVATDKSQDMEQNPVRAHFFETHLIQDLARLNGDSNKADANRDVAESKSDKLVTNLMSSMLDKIEESLLKEPAFHFSCHLCNSWKDSFQTKKGLEDHIHSKHSAELLENIDCLYCKQSFSWEDDNLEGYLKHLNENHQKDLTETKLIWPAKDSYCLSFVPTMSQLNDLLISVTADKRDTQKSVVEEEAMNGNEENMDEDTQSSKSSMAFSVTNESSNKVN